MSSKSAAGRANKELFVSLLRFIGLHPRTHKKRLSSLVPENSKRLWYAERHGYLRKNGATYTLTRKGKRALTEHSIWQLRIPSQRTWDKKWRLVLFDIPVDKRKRRDAFRLRLKEMGLVLYQRSVWVYPYPLEPIIRDLGDFYFLSTCVSLIVATTLSGEDKLKKHFRLK